MSNYHTAHCGNDPGSHFFPVRIYSLEDASHHVIIRGRKQLTTLWLKYIIIQIILMKVCVIWQYCRLVNVIHCHLTLK